MRFRKANIYRVTVIDGGCAQPMLGIRRITVDRHYAHLTPFVFFQHFQTMRQFYSPHRFPPTDFFQRVLVDSPAHEFPLRNLCDATQAVQGGYPLHTSHEFSTQRAKTSQLTKSGVGVEKLPPGKIAKIKSRQDAL